MRFPQIAVLLVVFLCLPAAAQQGANPVTAHYRAYRAALEHGDLATADAEAMAALEASQVRDGNGGSTAALALNLAFVRLSQGHREQAMAPAQLTASLAGNPQSHIDPLVADIAVKRAGLTTRDQSEATLLEALMRAHGRSELEEYVYDGASDLGGWAYQQRHMAITVQAWRLASQSSSGTSDAAVLARARALVALGVVLFRADLASEPGHVAMFDSQVSTVNLDYRPNVDSLAALAEAGRISRPLAARAGPGGALTQAQQVFSRAIVFFLAARSRAASYHAAPTISQDDNFYYALAIPSRPNASICSAHVVAEPMPQYPTHAVFEGHVGAVMARFVVDQNGHVSDARIVASVGGDAFSNAVERVLPRWQIAQPSSPQAGCEMGMTLFQSVTFVFRD